MSLELWLGAGGVGCRHKVSRGFCGSVRKGGRWGSRAKEDLHREEETYPTWSGGFDDLGWCREIRLVPRASGRGFVFEACVRVVEKDHPMLGTSRGHRLTAMSSGMFEANWSLWAIPHEGWSEIGIQRLSRHAALRLLWRKRYPAEGMGLDNESDQVP